MRGFRLSVGPCLCRRPHNPTPPFWTKNEGLNLDPILEPFWESFWKPLGSLGSSTALPAALQRGLPRRTLKMPHFQTPPGEAQVSSRVDGSTVFTVCRGPILAPILRSFWEPLGAHWLPKGSHTPPKGASREHPDFSPNFGPQKASETGGFF